jgi:hypothetical protein
MAIVAARSNRARSLKRSIGAAPGGAHGDLDAADRIAIGVADDAFDVRDG